MSTSAVPLQSLAARRSRGGGSSLNVLLTSDVHGGVWTQTLELARVFARRGHRVCLAVMGGALDARRATEAAAIDGVRLACAPFALEWMDDPWADVRRSGAWLLDLERQERPDIVHLNGYAHGCVPFRAPVVIGAHSCVCSWWRAVHGTAAPPGWNVYRAWVRAGLNGADRVIAPTLAMLRALAREHGALPPSRVILNGVDADLFRPSDRREARIVACGRWWDEAKNLRVLVDMDLPWPVELIGPALHPQGGEPPPGHPATTGPLPRTEVARRMATAGILVHPALYEPFGLVPLEAALSGCALVLADLPSLREVWGNAAVFVDPRDGAALRRAIVGLIRDDRRRERLARAALARARTLSADSMADAYLRTYRELSRVRSGVA